MEREGGGGGGREADIKVSARYAVLQSSGVM